MSSSKRVRIGRCRLALFAISMLLLLDCTAGYTQIANAQQTTPTVTIDSTQTSTPTLTSTPTPTLTPTSTPIPYSAQSNQLFTISRGRVKQTAWLEGGKRLAVASATGIWSFDALNWQAPPKLITSSADVNQMVVSADGKTISWLGMASAYVIDAITGQLRDSITMYGPEGTRGTAMTMSASGAAVASVAGIAPDQQLYVKRVGVDKDPNVILDSFGLSIGPWVQFSPDGSLSAFTDGTGHVLITPTAQLSNKLLDDFSRKYSVGSPIGFVAGITQFSPDGKILAVGQSSGTVLLIDPHTQQTIKTLLADTNSVTTILFDAVGDRLAVAHIPRSGDSQSSVVDVWQVSTGNKVHNYIGQDPVMSADGSLLATNTYSGDNRTPQVTVWDTASGKALWTKNNATAGVFQPNGKFFTIEIGDSGIIRVVNAADGKVIAIPEGFNNTVEALAFSADGQWLAIATADQSIHVRSTVTGIDRAVLIATNQPITSMVFSTDNQYIYAGTTDNLLLWLIVNGATPRKFPITGKIAAVALSNDGGKLAVATNQDLHIWNTASGQSQSIATGNYLLVKFTPDGKQLAALRDTSSSDNQTDFSAKVELWRVSGNKLLLSLDSHTTIQNSGLHRMPTLDFSTDGTRLAYASPDSPSTVIVYHLDKQQTTILDGLCLSETQLATTFSPDFQQVASICINGAYETNLNAYNLTNEHVSSEISGSNSWVDYPFLPELTGIDQILFSPDNRHLAIVNGAAGVFLIPIRH